MVKHRHKTMPITEVSSGASQAFTRLPAIHIIVTKPASEKVKSHEFLVSRCDQQSRTAAQTRSK